MERIFNADCLEGMKALESDSVDMILTDLPYSGRECALSLGNLWRQYKRVIKPNGAIVLFAKAPFDKVLGYSNIGMLRYEWTWIKSRLGGFLNTARAPLTQHENVLVFRGGTDGGTYNPQYGVGTPYKARSGRSNVYEDTEGKETVSLGERQPTDILFFDSVPKPLVPTQKPTALLQYLIRTYTNEGDVVLDSCMGSGSTAIACIREKRDFIGYEIKCEYFNIAKKRIDAEKMQPTLGLF